MRIPSSTAVEGRHADIMNTSCGWPQCLLQEGPRTMANVRRMTFDREIDYPTSDGRPMAETDWHRDLMTTLIAILKMWYAKIRRVYVSGNLLLYYLLWEEGKSPEMIIELTSKSTRKEDLDTKYMLYQDVLKVQEYFLFDPF